MIVKQNVHLVGYKVHNSAYSTHARDYNKAAENTKPQGALLQVARGTKREPVPGTGNGNPTDFPGNPRNLMRSAGSPSGSRRKYLAFFEIP